VIRKHSPARDQPSTAVDYQLIKETPQVLNQDSFGAPLFRTPNTHIIKPFDPETTSNSESDETNLESPSFQNPFLMDEEFEKKLASEFRYSETIFNNEEGAYREVEEKYKDKSRYKGYKMNGKKHGYGVLVLANGSRYEGDWKCDLMSGLGRLFYDTGVLAYEGGFLDNKVDGHGVMYNDQPSDEADGEKLDVDFMDLSGIKDNWEKFEGTFKCDMKHGIGNWVFLGGKSFTGEFKEDKADGKGVFSWVEGGETRKVFGVWKNSRLVRRFN
jgi:hypothetical protein